MASLGLLMIQLSVAFTCTLAQGAKEQWSMKIVVNYEYGAFQRFDSIWDGSPSTDYDPNLNEHRANTQAEPNYDQLCYQGIRFDIQTHAPFLNMINEADGRRETRRLPANYSPRLLGLSQVGSFIQLYVISTESGTCQSHHELKVVIFSTSYCELGVDTWCAYQGGPLTLTTGVPCSAKLPRMAIAPIDTDMMVLLDSNPQSGFLKCILVKPGQRLCRLGGDTLPKNRLENRYFFSTSSQETLVQVHLMEHNSFVQYIIDQFGSVRLLYSSDNTEKNPQCPMLSPNIFNCTVGMKFWNGTKLVHLDDAIGEPQSFQRNGTSGVVYVMQRGGESAVVVVHPLLSGGRQVLDNSTQVCRDSTAVKSVYVLGGGSVIVVAQCFPNGNLVFQVYLYQAKKACYELVPTRQPLQLKSGRSGKVLNILLIGHPFLVSPDEVNPTSALPPDVPSTVTPAPSVNISLVAVAIVLAVVLLIVIIASIIFYCICRKRPRKWVRLGRNNYEDKERLLGSEDCKGQPDNVDGVRDSKSSALPCESGDGDGGDGVVDINGDLALYHAGNRWSNTSSSDSEVHESSMSIQVTVEVSPLNGNRGDTATAITEVPEKTPPTRPDMITPPTRPEMTTPPTRPKMTTPPTRPDMIPPPTRPKMTTPPTRPKMTTPPTRPEMTTPTTRPEMTTSPTRPEMTTPPTRPEMTTLPTRPEMTTPPTRPEMTTPPTRPEMTTPPTRPEMTTLPTRRKMTTPPTRPEMTTPPTRPEMTTPPTRPEMTTPPTRPEVTTPLTRPEMTTPPTRPEMTTPPTRPEMTLPPTRPEMTIPPTRPEMTIPPTRPEMTTPFTRPEMTTPPTRPEMTTPPTRPEMTTSPTRLEMTIPPTRSDMTTPPTRPELPAPLSRPEMTTPPTRPELPAPLSRPDMTTPPTRPELPAPLSRPEMTTPPTRRALATSQVSEVRQPQFCVNLAVQGVIPERNKAREESVLNAEVQPPAQMPLTLYSVEEVEAKPSVEETGSAVSELAGHEAKVTSAVQIGARTPPYGE